MEWPNHHQLFITHNGHYTNYESVQDYLDRDNQIEISKKDRDECIRLGEIWEVQWYPNNPIGFYRVGGASLERCLEIINSQEWE